MPTFPSHWAGISGTIEPNETPYQAAQRELVEETNINQIVNKQGGLFLDVPYVSQRTQEKRIIRVYPFVVHIPYDDDDDACSLELRGTEHDGYKFVTIDELTNMESKCVPGLVKAFHRATYGQFQTDIPNKVRQWASDKENGASIMTQNAIRLVVAAAADNGNDEDSISMADQISILRPSMVPIVNVMNQIIHKGKDYISMDTLLEEIEKSVKLGREAVEDIQSQKKDQQRPLTIATFSRSGTLLKILKPIAKSCNIICAQSTPGDEGELMAQDLETKWIPDEEMYQMLATKGSIDVLLVGSDCILQKLMVNKVGTKKLCEIAKENQVPVFCCADRWKIWDDIFPPPLEADLFECVPLDLVSRLLVPHSLQE